MSIPPEINALIIRIRSELDETEREARKGLSLVRPILSYFPDNLRLIYYLSLFNNTLLFMDLARIRIEATIDRISPNDVTLEEIIEAGEDLSTLIGRIIETKIEIRQIIKILEEIS